MVTGRSNNGGVSFLRRINVGLFFTKKKTCVLDETTITLRNVLRSKFSFLDMSSSSTYKLTYFNVRGLAETSRMLFSAAGQQFEDYRYPFELKDGKKIHTEWDADKSKYIYEKVPVLEVDGGKHTIAQSKAIERFLARRFNMLGSNDGEAALIGKKNTFVLYKIEVSTILLNRCSW